MSGVNIIKGRVTQTQNIGPVTTIKVQSHYSVVEEGGRYFVMFHGEPVYSTDSRFGALTKMGRLVANHERQSVNRERPCIRCRTPMKSEGPHHRMCGYCRHRTAGLI